MADNDKAAVYVAWATFNNALNQLAQGIPNRIDRSVFAGQSGGVQAQLIAGLKFLDLIDEAGKPSQALVALAVPDEDARKKVLATILRKQYADLFALDLMKTTPAELAEKMTKSYIVTGDSREKAIRFFLAALGYTGIPVSAFLKKRTGSTATPSAPRRRRQSIRSNANNATPPPKPSGSGASRTIRLKSGGTLTLAAEIDLFAMTNEDRTFVFGLIDQIEQYGGVEVSADDDGEEPGDDENE